MKHKRLIQCISIAMATGGLAACGGGGGGGTSVGDGPTDTNIPVASTATIGTITGFGSIYVNGIEFETDDSSFRVDDEDQFDDSALALGMKVKVTGTVNADGRTGHADSVIYDDDLEGPIDAGSLEVIDATTKTFSIFGFTVRADANGTVYDDGASFDTLADGQTLEISGYFDGVQIIATRIEKQGDADDEFELKGVVENYDGDTITVTLLNGTSAGPFAISDNALLEIPADPSGLFVEVKLTDQSGELIVIKIETEDEGLLDDDDEDGEVSMRGVLVDDGSGGFLINGMPLEVNANTEYRPVSLDGNLVAGLQVKVEGRVEGGVLIIREVESRSGEIEIEARMIGVTSSDAKNGIVTLDMGGGQSLDVHTDNSTLFGDHSEEDLNDDDSFDLNELSEGLEFLEIEAYLDETGQLIATSIEREGELDDTKLEASLTDFEASVSVTLLGITYTVDGATRYEIDDNEQNDDDQIDATGFFDRLGGNDIVKVKDVEPDGVADELELED